MVRVCGVLCIPGMCLAVDTYLQVNILCTMFFPQRRVEHVAGASDPILILQMVGVSLPTPEWLGWPNLIRKSLRQPWVFFYLSPYVVPQAVRNIPLPAGSLLCNCRWPSASSIGSISLSLEARPRVCCKTRLIPCQGSTGQLCSHGREQLSSRNVITAREFCRTIAD